MKVGMLAFALVLTAGGFAAQSANIDLKVAAVQFRSTFDLQDNCKRIAAHLKKLAGEGVQVAIFPECALTGYRKDTVVPATAAEIQAAEGRLQQTCRGAHIAAIVGSVYKINGRAYDTAIVIDSHGALIERYGKIYLAGEKWATPGNHISFFELNGVPSTVMICHDERYPELVRLPALEGARVVYYISAESPLTKERKLKPYRAQVMARAVENGVIIVQANAPANPDLSGSHGQSRIVDSDGNVVSEASFFSEDVLIGTLAIHPGTLKRPLDGLMGHWWREGVNFMMNNRHRQLD